MHSASSASLDAPRSVEVLVVIQSEKGRAGLYAWAERALAADEALVVVKDLVGARRGMRTTPTDPRARLVAVEPPAVLRGGLTALTSYFVVPADGLDAVETHLEGGKPTHTYDVLLRVARLGKREARALPA